MRKNFPASYNLDSWRDYPAGGIKMIERERRCLNEIKKNCSIFFILCFIG